jgi:hypothetical protein
MFPDCDPTTGQLPVGVFHATFKEVADRYGYNSHRLHLLRGLKEAVTNLRRAGCRRVYLDGSFISAAPTPGDFDGCWAADGVDEDLVDPVLLDVTNEREVQLAKYGGELYMVEEAAAPGTAGRRMLEFYQQDDRTGLGKGIIAINLAEEG